MAWLAAALGLALLVVVPPLVGGYILRQLASYLLFGLLALSAGLLTGYGRLFNLGVGVHFGSACYGAAIALHSGVSNPWAVLGVSVAAGTASGIVFAVFAIVASGIEYLMLTFLATLAVGTLVLGLPAAVAGGINGLPLRFDFEPSFGQDPLSGPGFYWLVLGCVAATGLLSWFILSSQNGRVMQAIARNPSRLAAMGYNVPLYFSLLTLYAAFVGSLGGWLFILQTSFVYRDLLGLQTSETALAYALIGGAETILGPFLGAASLQWITQVLSRGSSQSSLFIGGIFILVAYGLPNGLMGVPHQLVRAVQSGRLAREKRRR